MSQPQQTTENAAPLPAISPCPCCGCEAHRQTTGHAYWRNRIVCSGCFLRTDDYGDAHLAAMIADWNRRTPPQMTREEARRITFAEVYGVTTGE